jgi:site-specific DNA-cytosine methylase
MDNGINVLSLFDGMSSGRIALERLGIKVNQYFASEIDKHAITVSKANYPDIIHIGDVTKVKACDLPPIQLVLAGSPCQGFSFAGKQLAFDDPRSALFFEFVRIWNEVKGINPDARFLLENVKMKKEHELVISRYMGVAPIEIDASLVSAQSRKRLFWTNIANKPYGLFGDMECTIPQPKDKGILLRDILDTDVPEKYYLSEKLIKGFLKHNEVHKERGNGFNFSPKSEDEKSNCLNAMYYKMGVDDTYIVASRGRNPENPGSRESGIELEQTLEPPISGCIKFGRTEEAKQIRKESIAKGKDYTPHAKKEISGIDFEKMNTLTTAVNKDNLILQINPSKESGGKQPYQQNRIYDPNGISHALCAGKSDLLIISGTLRTHNDGKGFRPVKDEKAATIPARGREDGSGQNAVMLIRIPEATKQGYVDVKPGDCFDLTMPDSETRRGRLMEDKSNCLTASKFDFMQYTQDYRIRRLTPTECEKLQTVPVGFTAHVSDSQRYKMLGNGWCIDVIVHILSYLNLPCPTT